MATRRKRNKPSRMRRILYWTSHIACAIAVIMIFLTLVQCTIKKPEAPTWRTNLVVPMANKTWTMTELIDKIDQENLTTDAEGNPYFFYRTVLDTVTITGDFSLGDVADTVSDSLGVIGLDSIPETSVSIDLSDYVTLELGVVPPMSFDIIDTMPALGDFTRATVESGFAVVRVVNDFGLDLDTVTVFINDLIFANPVAFYSVPGGIPAGETSTDTIDLAGKTISNLLEMTIHCHTPGAVSFSLADKSLSSQIGMPSGLNVSSAVGKIPQIEKSISQPIEIDSDHKLESAVLENGQLSLEIHNNTNLSADLTISIPDIQNGGVPFVVNQPIAANDADVFTYDLAGYSIEPVDQELPQGLAVDITALINSSGDDHIAVSAGDDIWVAASITGLSLSSVEGVLAPTTAEFVDINQNIEVPTGFENMQLPSAIIIMEVENAVNIPGSFTITVDGDQGQHKVIDGTVLPGTPEAPVVSIIADSSLGTFMSPIPETITVNGSATFGDGVTSGSVNPDDVVVAAITITSPLELIIDAASFDGEYESTKIEQDDISKITDNLKLASFYTTVSNRLPLGVSAQILLGGDSATLYSDPELVLGPIDVAPGVLRPDGTVEAPTISENVLAIDSTQISILENPTLWIGEIFTLQSTNGESVRLTASDSLTVNSYIEVDFNFSESLWEDD